MSAAKQDTYSQQKGIEAGLSVAQVSYDWFKYNHFLAAKAGIPYEQYQGLTESQIAYGILRGLNRDQVEGVIEDWCLEWRLGGMVSGLTKTQVNQPWFRISHCRAAEEGFSYESYQGLTETQVNSGIRKGLSREQVEWATGDESDYQLRGMVAGLSKEQVNHAWFGVEHATAAEEGFLYESYQGLTQCQVSEGIRKGLSREQAEGIDNPGQLWGIRFGLTRAQVQNDWFSTVHAGAAQEGMPYAHYEGLTSDQVHAMRFKKLRREQVEGLNQSQIILVKEHCLPTANIVRGLDYPAAHRAAKKFRVSERVALAMGGHLRLGAGSVLNRDGIRDNLSEIGKFI
jgi:hypothetical protein